MGNAVAKPNIDRHGKLPFEEWTIKATTKGAYTSAKPDEPPTKEEEE